MTLVEGWLIPDRSPEWLSWKFGTRDANLRNELAQVRQVHGAEALTVSKTGLAGEADALVTATPSVALGIKTADCLPILLADLRNEAIGAAHAGWRGTALGVLDRTIGLMDENYGTKPNDLLIAFGPSIGKCCFEVGPEVARQFAEYDPALREATGKVYLDLQNINIWRLRRLGVAAEQILRNELCTFCGGDAFWSYRRQGEKAGRMWSVVEKQR